MDNLFSIALFTYALAAIIMFLVPESWLPKKRYPEEIGTGEEGNKKAGADKGYYRKVFLLFGLGVLAILFIVNYIMG
jgi:hypothetical protein